MKKLTHLNKEGRPHMVDVSGKEATQRRAVAQGRISLSEKAASIVADETNKKGNVLTTAELAGIMAAKKTSDLIPLCHPVPLDGIDVSCTLQERVITCRAEARCTHKTGVEMEALQAVSQALLTVYDMCKAVDRAMVISDIKLMEKEGGASGRFERNEK
jgi:cyclic pyranopterin phosphate synthase